MAKQKCETCRFNPSNSKVGTIFCTRPNFGGNFCDSDNNWVLYEESQFKPEVKPETLEETIAKTISRHNILDNELYQGILRAIHDAGYKSPEGIKEGLAEFVKQANIENGYVKLADDQTPPDVYRATHNGKEYDALIPQGIKSILFTPDANGERWMKVKNV